jgi:hypothetical protein
MKSIEILVGPTGDLRIDAVGFSGADCDRATAFLEEVLGKVATKHRKPEFYRKSRRKLVQRGGV